MQAGQSRNPNDHDLATSEDAEEVQWQEVRLTLGVGSDPRVTVGGVMNADIAARLSVLVFTTSVLTPLPTPLTSLGA
jgi:hypothetical protein